MLRERFITALIMLALFLSAVIFLPLTWTAIFMGSIVIVAAWEWAPMAAWKSLFMKVLFVSVLAVLLFTVWVCYDLGVGLSRDRAQFWFTTVCLFWLFIILLVGSYPNGRWVWRRWIVRSLMGWVALLGGWVSVVFLLTLTNGAILLILMVFGVAMSDIGAYFSGRRWGRHKLASHISPAKTWEGVLGGFLMVMTAVVIIWALLPQAYQHLQLGSLLLIGFALVVASVLGDLSVSMLKRINGVSDSGVILPGHGGMLDRLDSVICAAPVFTLSLILIGY